MVKKSLGFLFLAVFLIFLFHDVSVAGSIKYTVGGHAAAMSEKLLDRVVDLSVAKDYEALQKLLNSGLVIMLKKDVKVEVLDTKLFSGKVKIRPFGTNLELWTVIDAIKEIRYKSNRNEKNSCFNFNFTFLDSSLLFICFLRRNHKPFKKGIRTQDRNVTTSCN